MSMTREERIRRADEIFATVWGDQGARASYNTIEDCAADLITWAEELESEPSPYKIPNQKIAAALREVAQRLEGIDLEDTRGVA